MYLAKIIFIKVHNYISFIRSLYLVLKNFIPYNLFCLLRNSNIIKNIPTFNQKTKVTGKGKVFVGKECRFGFKLGGFFRGSGIELQSRVKGSEIIINDNVWTNNNIFICAINKIVIGTNTLIGQNVSIFDFEAHGISPLNRRELGQVGFVEIQDNVWIGNDVTILKNTKIGSNSIVATGAVVAGVFPKNVIIGGIPAKIIRTLDSSN